MSYQPYTLPRLPRQQCPYEVLVLHQEKSGMRVTCQTCHHLAERKTGWCEEHAYVHELLEAAIEAGCPEMVIATVYNPDTRKREPVLIVRAGLDNWETYALRHTLRHHESVMQKLRDIKAQKDKANQAAIEKAAKRARNAA